MIKMHRKFRFKVTYIAGDPYYEEMSVEETISKFFTGPEKND